MKSILINTNEQRLLLSEDSHLIKSYPVSTAVNGLGEVEGSGCTPRGLHIIRAKIGQRMPANAIFSSRRPTGTLYTDESFINEKQRDFILGRILWLSGLQLGYNRMGRVDTMRRYIYIHGAPDSGITDAPSSKGCVRMYIRDIVELYNYIDVGCRVMIK
jgi:L,D-transpeptidase YbiS